MKDTFLSALAKDGAINEAAISFENLGKIYGSLQKQVSENLQKQEPLLEKIKVSLITIYFDSLWRLPSFASFVGCP